MKVLPNINNWKPVDGTPGIFVLEDHSKQTVVANTNLQKIVAQLNDIIEFHPQRRRRSSIQLKTI